MNCCFFLCLVPSFPGDTTSITRLGGILMSWTNVILLVQLVFGVIVGAYFWHLLKNQRTQRISIDKESKKEMEQLRKMRLISLTEPLAQRVRPTSFQDIIGQEDGIKSLQAALCGPNPQHVIIYGPPGVGKTAAARLVLEEAKKNPKSPFRPNSVFIELDATTARFDERGIADPLIGSVHDPIYQGAGAMGQAGVPQPKRGAVTDAHGGVLFIDEIGELHPIQMNKMLKVLEDRKVFLESAYYSEENSLIPTYIHDIFKNGLPADFRLVGATTRSPEEISPAIRSRCLEVFFHELETDEIEKVATVASNKIGLQISQQGLARIGLYAKNGREAINLVQLAAGMAINEERGNIRDEDIEWVIHSNQLTPKLEKRIYPIPKIGLVNGLAVYGPNMGALLELEVTAIPVEGKGEIVITGIVEEESVGNQTKSIRRKSMVKGSADNVITVLRSLNLLPKGYDLHINFPGGVPVDGPSAGIAIATGVYSAVHSVYVRNDVALTGEISIHGEVKPVGGVYAKVKAAKKAGVKTVLIPADNLQPMLYNITGIEIVPVRHIRDVFARIFVDHILTEYADTRRSALLHDEGEMHSM